MHLQQVWPWIYVNISHLKVKFSLPPEQAWPGAQDYLLWLKTPAIFKGTEVEQLADLLRQKWPGTRPEARSIKRLTRMLKER